MEAVAKLKNYPGSPRKARLVADLIRNMDVNKALGILKFTRKHAARPIEKLLLSAISNWEAKNPGMSLEDSDLYVKRIWVDGGRMLKRFQPAPFGRAYRIRKRSNHVTIILDSRNELLDDFNEFVSNVEEAAVAADVDVDAEVLENDNNQNDN